MTRRRRLALAVLGPLVALVLAELVLRVFVLPNPKLVWRPLPPFGTLQTAEQRAWVERQRSELAGKTPPRGYSQFDPLLGWAPRPSSSTPDGKIHVNARGIRGTHDYGESIPRSMVRAVACGDSFTFCEEVADLEAWPAQVEALWPKCQFLNYGCGGYGTDQAYLRLSTSAIGQVDAVVVGLLLENIGRNVNRYRPLWYPLAIPAVKPRYVLRDGELELVPQPFATREELVAAVESGQVLEELAEHEFWSERHVPPGLGWSAIARLLGAKLADAARERRALWTDVEGEPFRTTLALLEAFRALAHELGTENVLVVIFPTDGDLRGFIETGERYWTTLTDALESRGIAHIDLSGPLAAAERARQPSDPPLYLESHLSKAGNAIVAKKVKEWLEPRLMADH